MVDVDNQPALAVYRKLGFHDEGVLRHEFFVNGEYRDALRMAIFQPEFLAWRLQRAAAVAPSVACPRHEPLAAKL